MSSNAFARSRPRVRHQRMPRGSSSYDHPRFLQLVNELARLNDLKRKQEEAISGGPSSSSCGVNDCNEDDGGGGSAGGEGPYFSNNQATTASICCNAPTLNGYRSLDNNQPTSALQDNYHHHQQQQHHPYLHHHHHQQQQLNLQQHHQSIEHQHHQQAQQQPNYIHHNHQLHHPPDSQLISNTNLQQSRCQVGGEQSISKSSSTSFGYSKQNLVVEQQQQHSSDVSTNNSDLRQDENRSKRKRTGFDSSAAASSASSTSSAAHSRKLSSCGATSKRHKSSSDTIRPLSPSFTKCPICLLDCMDRDPSFTNTCFHLFCYVCIENWTKNKTSCPLCRTKFTKIIFNIKSATVYDEKTASPIRRDDDDGYIADRLMIEHLPGLNSSSTVPNRSTNNDDVQFLFENLRNAEVLMPPYFVNQLDPRQGESLHSFNTVTATTNFNSNVPHPQFTPTSYPLTPNYIALFPPSRIAQPTTNAAIASAYGANTSLASNLNNNDPSGNRPRTSRSGRYIYTRNYDFPSHDGPTTRIPRSSNNATTVTLQGVAEVRHNHHHHHHQPHQHQQQHPNHHHQHHHHNNQHRSTIDMSSNSTQNQQSQHAHIPLSYPYPPNSYPRRPFNSSQVEQQLLDNLYRNMPDM